MIKLTHSAELNQIASALKILLKRFMTTASAGGFFLEVISSSKDRVI